LDQGIGGGDGMTVGGLSTTPRPTDVNYDEALVPRYVLPDPLICRDGSPVDSPDVWRQRRRPELLELFTSEIYGRVPGPATVDVETFSCNRKALSGFATRHELDVRVSACGASLTLQLLVWVPNHVVRPVPAYLGLNYFGNQAVHPDPEIRLAQGWVPNDPELGIIDNLATDASRGLRARRWPVELLLTRGYALATVYAGDIDPDYDDGFNNGAHGLFAANSGKSRGPQSWGAIAAWAWGLSRALDALSTLDAIDARHIGVIGHSRLGKAALWAAAQDERFAWAVSNNSGHGGASLSRRRFGELTRHLNDRFPHWFAAKFRQYDDHENELPVDQHELLALMAPRPVYVASAALDLWSDPRGEWLACLNASPVYELHGVGGVRACLDGATSQSSSLGNVGYHCRPGNHDMIATDWWHYLDFADRYRR
jgi:hypothetical protein